LVPARNVVVVGAGTERTVTVTATPNRTGRTTIELVVTDGRRVGRTTFVVTVGTAT
jgi:hypothetical protein